MKSVPHLRKPVAAVAAVVAQLRPLVVVEVAAVVPLLRRADNAALHRLPRFLRFPHLMLARRPMPQLRPQPAAAVVLAAVAEVMVPLLPQRAQLLRPVAAVRPHQLQVQR